MINSQDSPQNAPTHREHHSPHCPHQSAEGFYGEDEISLLDCWRVLWPQRKLIAAITLSSAVLALIVSLVLPDIYRAEVLLAPVANEENTGGLASALGNLGGLASMAGISLPGGGNAEENLAVLKSREFLGKFVQDKGLLPILFADEWNLKSKSWKAGDPSEQPSQWDAYRLLTGDVMKVSQDKRTSLVSVAIEWSNPALAASWANELISRLNDYLRKQAIARSQKNLMYLNEALAATPIAEMRQTLFALIAEEQKKAMLANTQEEFAFRVIDQAAEPDKKTRPHRTIIVILGTLVGAALSLVFVSIRYWLQVHQEGPKS